jgi:hypothetical protein
MKTTVGEKLAILTTVIRQDSGCVGCMGPETPFIIFREVSTGRLFRWQSDTVDTSNARDIPVGTTVQLNAYNYNGRLRRVKVTLL